MRMALFLISFAAVALWAEAAAAQTWVARCDVGVDSRCNNSIDGPGSLCLAV